MSRRTIILITISLVIILTVSVGYRIWNRPAEKVENITAETIDARSLYHSFQKNEGAANQRFLGKALEIDGVVAEISKNQDSHTVAVLAASDPLGGIQCTFRDDVTLRVGQKIKTKGFCNGYTVVVLLNECIIL